MELRDPGDSRDLMRRVAEGDREAAGTLFERHGDAVYRYLRGMGVEGRDAEDLTQEAFLKALSAASSYRGRGSVEGWLLRIARTVALDRRRSDAARREREGAWAEERETRGHGDAAGSLARLLRELPPEDREVIVLARFLDFPSARVAEVLEITPGAARVRLHRALGRLAERWSGVEAS